MTTEGFDAALLDLVLATAEAEEHLNGVARLAQDLSPVLAACGVMARMRGAEITVASSNELAYALDEVQFGLDRGPCLQAMRGGDVVYAEDMTVEARWTPYPALAVERGVLSSLSLPLVARGRTVGALNSYAREPHAFDGDLADQLRAFAERAQVVLAVAMRSAEQTALVDQLHAAMQSRSTIDQAMGIVMGRERCTSAEAFALLRTASQRQNRKLADVAVDLITTTTGQPPVPGHFDAGTPSA
ncbi:GAF and ANTAR domain-containing protein [Actinotalea sp. AC32]|nr:GAF and ANTAR domain-containing protein [Actinotalea sp. AC32]